MFTQFSKWPFVGFILAFSFRLSRRVERKWSPREGTELGWPGRWCEKLTISIFNNSRSSRTETIIVDLTKPECEFSLKRFPSIFSFLRELSVVAHVRRARGRLVSTLTSDGFSALLSGRLSVSQFTVRQRADMESHNEMEIKKVKYCMLCSDERYFCTVPCASRSRHNFYQPFSHPSR